MVCATCPSTRLVSPKDGLCPTCRIRKYSVYPTYVWTPAMSDLLCAVYRTAKSKADLSTSLTILAKRFRFPRCVLLNRAQFLGLRIREQRVWTPEEIATLHEMGGSHSLRAIGKQLARSPSAVKNKLFQLRISSVLTEGFSREELARLMGVKHGKIARWVERGWLLLDENDRVTQASVERFVWDRMEEIRFVACEEWWLKQMLREGRNRKSKPGPQRMPDVAFRRSA